MKYRDNVCAVIRKKTGNSVLICHRKGASKNKGWQFPQGGIDIQKDLIDELKRELLEEIGTDDIAIISISPHTYRYDFPEGITCRHKQYCGQQQRWVLAELNADDDMLYFKGRSVEFDAFEWITPHEAFLRIIDFKKDVYRQAMINLGLL